VCNNKTKKVPKVCILWQDYIIYSPFFKKICVFSVIFSSSLSSSSLLFPYSSTFFSFDGTNFTLHGQEKTARTKSNIRISNWIQTRKKLHSVISFLHIKTITTPFIYYIFSFVPYVFSQIVSFLSFRSTELRTHIFFGVSKQKLLKINSKNIQK